MRTLFFGDGLWATNSLQRLAYEGYVLVGLVVRTKPTAPDLLAVAETLDLPILQPRQVNASEFVAEVSALQPDLNLSLSYNQIFKRPILDTAPLGFVNFHAGKLPYFRGRNVINWAIINGETEIGLTAHYVDEGIDTGDIILQRILPLNWTDSYGDVLNRVVDAFPDLVSETVRSIATGQVQRRTQAHLPGSYMAGRGVDDEWLDWSDNSLSLYNKIRAISHPGPGARTLLGEQVVVVWKASYDPDWPVYKATPGQVVGGRPDEGVIVKTGDSTLLLQQVQVGKGEIQTPNWGIGTRLGINLLAYMHTLEARVKSTEHMLIPLRMGAPRRKNLEHLKKVPINERLLTKHFHDLNCVILGGGGHARVLMDCLLSVEDIRIFAVLVKNPNLWGKEFFGVPILGEDSLLGEVVSAGVNSFVVGLGSTGDNRPRQRLFELGLSYNWEPLTLRHATAICSRNAVIGVGTQLLPGSIVNAGAVLGDNVIVNSGALVEHDCAIGDHVHVASGAKLAGGVRVEAGAFVGAGAAIRQNICIGAYAIVGLGAVVVKDVPPNTVVAGVPAKPL